MNRSSNSVDGPLSTSMKVTTQEDGTIKAEALGAVGKVVQPVVGRNTSEAISLLKQSLQEAAAKGTI